MYVCMYVCMHVCVYVCLLACLLVCFFVSLFLCWYVCIGGGAGSYYIFIHHTCHRPTFSSCCALLRFVCCLWTRWIRSLHPWKLPDVVAWIHHCAAIQWCCMVSHEDHRWQGEITIRIIAIDSCWLSQPLTHVDNLNKLSNCAKFLVSLSLRHHVRSIASKRLVAGAPWLVHMHGGSQAIHCTVPRDTSVARQCSHSREASGGAQAFDRNLYPFGWIFKESTCSSDRCWIHWFS